MTNTTDSYWSANGVSLQTHAQNIETLASRMAPAPFRGEDITIPYAAGQRFIPKVVDSRILPLGMWIRGCNPDGSVPANRSEKFDDNWRALRSLLWNPRRQFALQKRIIQGGVTNTVTALAQYHGGLEPAMMGRYGAKFVVDLKLADPFFYDDAYTTFNLVNGDQTISVPGDSETTNILLTINGSRVNPEVRVTNDNGVTKVKYNGHLLSGESAQIDIKNYESTTTPSGTPTFDSSGMVTHSGEAQWLVLAAGDNVVNVQSTSGIGTIQLQVKGAWL